MLIIIQQLVVIETAVIGNGMSLARNMYQISQNFVAVMTNDGVDVTSGKRFVKDLQLF